MAYRSIRRVIGETSLERKCRFLFGVCLSVLLFVTFWWVEHIAEQLVEETAIRKARDLVDSSLLRQHWEIWDTDEEARGLAAELSRDLGTQNYGRAFISLEPDHGTVLPADAEEEEIVRQLKAEYREQMEQQAQSLDDLAGLDAAPVDGTTPPATDSAASGMPGGAIAPTPGTSSPEILPVYRFKRDLEHQTIHYYQPVSWKASCSRCHEGFEGIDALQRAEAVMFLEDQFRVVKVTYSEDETQDSITRSRALLTAIGILTVFMAMVLLYMIIRYVVVKPLKHLRDVADRISRGDTELRADIHTSDEFEELANAFNRMLRHLTDAQQELRNVNKDLDAKVDQLAQLSMRLYEMNRLKSDFLANMSHELRTPLNSIIGFSEVLQGISTLTDRQRRYAQNIQRSGRQLLDMINDLLDVAKIEAGKMETHPSEFRIDVLVTTQCDLVRSLSEEKNIDLIVAIEPDLPPMYQDQGKIQQILTNLLSNAIKFTPDGGRIEVEALRDSQDRLHLTVTDTGVGIAEEDREIIFEKFRQSAHTIGDGNLTREYSGTGLGLSIVKESCKLLGGEISFTSELGKGSCFRVVLPWSLPTTQIEVTGLEAELNEIARAQRRAALIKTQRPASAPT